MVVDNVNKRKKIGCGRGVSFRKFVLLQMNIEYTMTMEKSTFLWENLFFNDCVKFYKQRLFNKKLRMIYVLVAIGYSFSVPM